MAAYLLPEIVLNQQLCSTCKQYLSCPPTKIYVSGEIKCGRCSSPDDDGTLSAFETLARNVLFPCSNRFAGCPERLLYADVKQHERNCAELTIDCPNCANATGSTLYIIHHFRIKHFKELLLKPKMEFDLKSRFERFLLYCDYERNQLFLLRIRWEEQMFSVSCFTGVTQTRTHLRVLFRDPTKDDPNEYSTNVKPCLDIQNFPSSFPKDCIEFQVPVHLASVTCEFQFNDTALLVKVPEFRTRHYEANKRKVMRKIHLNDNFKTKYPTLSANGFRVSACGQKLQQQNYSLHIACDFCENFFAYSGDIKEIFSDLRSYVCGTCYKRGVENSLSNPHTTLTKMEAPDYYLLSFYCAHGCGRFCKSGELLSHEDQCAYNIRKSLSEEDYVKAFFGNSVVKADKYSKENVIVDANKYKGKGKILIATRDNFKCTIDYESDGNSNRCNFHVNHEYDPARFYIKVHKWEDRKHSEEFNDFSMKTKYYEGPSLFAITLKEILDDSDTFYDV